MFWNHSVAQSNYIMPWNSETEIKIQSTDSQNVLTYSVGEMHSQFLKYFDMFYIPGDLVVLG
jgi:hypothetical protein